MGTVDEIPIHTEASPINHTDDTSRYGLYTIWRTGHLVTMKHHTCWAALHCLSSECIYSYRTLMMQDT